MIKESVLVVDDNKTTRDILRTILESEGYAVACCADGLSAVDMAAKQAFCAFLVDYRMPAMNGLETTAVLRRLHPGKHIIGFSIENREHDFLKAGADLFIRKDELSTRLVSELQEFSRKCGLDTLSNVDK